MADAIGPSLWVDASRRTEHPPLTGTHMGCVLRFNQAELSWDCPCHGSRFDIDGHVLQGPAIKALERRPVS